MEIRQVNGSAFALLSGGGVVRGPAKPGFHLSHKRNLPRPVPEELDLVERGHDGFVGDGYPRRQDARCPPKEVSVDGVVLRRRPRPEGAANERKIQIKE